MRTNDVLIEGFENIKILQQYLYMSDEHYIEVKNSIDVPLRIYMNDKAQWMCQNMNIPDVPPMYYQEQMTIGTMLAIIDQLKEQPAVEYPAGVDRPNGFTNRWEEIRGLTIANVTQNRMKYTLERNRR